MDKQTESREKFDFWWNTEMSMAFYSTTKEHKDTAYHAAWLSWQKSRESLVVALPKREAFESYPHESYMIDDDNGEYIPYAETVGAIRSIGIRIKGEGV